MKRQEIIDKFTKQLSIENYSEQTIKNYLSALKLFLDWIGNSKVKKVTEEAIQDYLFYCKNDRKYAFSTMKQVIAAISFLYKKVFFKPIPKASDIKLIKPMHLPIVLSNREIAKIMRQQIT